MKKVKAVFFDAGGTLIRPYPSVGEIYAKAALDYGMKCRPQALEAAFYSAWKKRGGLASLGDETSEEKEKAWWHNLVSEIFASQGDFPQFDEFFAGLHRSFEEKHLWEIFPEVLEVLTELRNRKMILGIVSNWDLRFPKVLRNLELDTYFDFWVSSSVCGTTKPHPKIFNEALHKAGVLAEEAIHVGDTYEEDVVGAEALGIKALLIDRLGTINHAPQQIKIKSLKEILDKLLF